MSFFRQTADYFDWFGDDLDLPGLQAGTAGGDCAGRKRGTNRNPIDFTARTFSSFPK
jgi:hypothetical protein